MYLVKHSPVSTFGFWSCIVTVSFGLVMIYLNYESDRQRQEFRATNGTAKIWGRLPRAIHAVYTSEQGHVKKSLLLASGFWGMSRHINYVFELLAALSWSIPALTSSLIPYFYFLFLFVLLVHRSHRDDVKCRNKYTKYWNQYCELVPYKILPYIY